MFVKHEFPLPSKEERYQNINTARPRLWLNPQGVESFKAKLKQDPAYCGFDQFYKYSVLPRVAEGITPEPKPYPDNKRVVALWRSNYSDCQTTMCYIRSLSVAGVLMEDDELLAKAKAALLTLAEWDVNGPTSRLYNDECAYRVGYGLAYGYDWLHHLLNDEEKAKVFNALFLRTKEIADYAMETAKIHENPYDSHAVRSLGMLLSPCCIALLDPNSPTYAEVQKWMDYVLNYFATLYSPWADEDGGWAEGTGYWTTGMAFAIEGLNFIRNYFGIDFYKKPFFQKTGEFMMRCNPPDAYRTGFGCQSNLGQKPGPKMAFNMRQFAGLSNNGEYQWYFDSIMSRSEMAPKDFSNKGWWDLHYDDVVFRHDFGTVPAKAPSNDVTVSHFRGVGWASIHKNMADFDKHIYLLAKSSPFGSISHSYADQNSFTLFAFGEPIIITSGHYVAYGSQMHLSWRKTTKGSNAILIDGIGQFSGRDWAAHHEARSRSQDITAGEQKKRMLAAKGHIVDIIENEKHICITMDATEAYAETVPYLRNYTRELYWIKEADDNRGKIVIKDYVSLNQEGSITSLLHALNPFEISGDTFKMPVGNVNLTGKVESASSGVDSITQSDKFDGVEDASELEGLDKQSHLFIKTKPAKRHVLEVSLSFEKDGKSS